MKFIVSIFKSMAVQVKGVNEKYKKPEIEMTPFVRTCLIGLRVYLFILGGMMLYKFIILASHGG